MGHIIEDRKKYMKDYSKRYYDANRQKLNDYNKEYRKLNGRRGRKERKNDDIKSKECISCTNEWRREYYKKNKDKIRERVKIWKQERLETDPLFKLKISIREIIKKGLKKKKGRKTFEIIGCSFEEFKSYIESKFEPWMSWDNYGRFNNKPNYGWDFDHIVPISSATNEDELLKLNNYKNFQPLCSYINRMVKRNKL
jgi:hypothetical protein